MVEVVELGDGGEAGLQHLHVELGGDGLDVLGREPVEEAVHDLAPGPEAVGGGPTDLGQAGHAALERVAVQVGHAGERNPGAAVGTGGGRIGDHGRDLAAAEADPHASGPAIRQQCHVEEEVGHCGYPPRAYVWRRKGRQGRRHACASTGCGSMPGLPHSTRPARTWA